MTIRVATPDPNDSRATGIWARGVSALALTITVSAMTTPFFGAAPQAAAATAPSSESTPQPNPTPSTSAQAQRQATEAADHVNQLLADHRRYEAGVKRAAEVLTSAFRAGATADHDRDLAESEAKVTRRRQALQLRALYQDGGLSFSLSILAADTPTDALWRMSVAPRVGARMVSDAEAEQQVSLDRARVASARSAEAQATAEKTSAALSQLHDQVDASQRSLQQARAELAGLNATVKRLAAAEAAAAALRRAEEAAAATQLSVGPVAALGIPQEYVTAYRASAGACAGMRWTLLAAVGQVESGHGRNVGPSTAGAVGPMQFMPATFGQYGLDADSNGVADPLDPQDAIATAARYLCAEGVDGTPAGDQSALFAYNRAQWYVDLVLRTEESIKAQNAPGQ